jgi:preprotein translocase subunit SecE
MFTVASGSDEPKPVKPQTPPAPTKNLKRRGLKGYFADVGREMKKVTWPTRHETNRLTGVVLIVCAMLVAILSVLGFVFEQVIDLVTKGQL